MLNSHNTADIPSLEPNGTFDFHPETEGVRVTVSWTSKQQGIVCDLDLNAFFYDERVGHYLPLFLLVAHSVCCVGPGTFLRQSRRGQQTLD